MEAGYIVMFVLGVLVVAGLGVSLIMIVLKGIKSGQWPVK